MAPISAAMRKRADLLDRLLTACLCWVFGSFCASAAFPPYRFISWTTENGLPNNWIMAIHQTRDGYLWLTTEDGMARFDGVRFQVFNKINTPGLTTNWFAYRALWEDRCGNLWIGTQESGLVRYHDGVFTTLTTKDGLPSNEVIRIDGDGAGTVWITTSAGVVRWRNGHLVLPRSKFDRSLDAWLTQPKNFWIDAHFFGLWRFRARESQRFAYGHWSSLPLPPGIRNPANIQVTAIAEDSGRRLWYSLKGHPHEYYCAANGHLKIIHGVPQTSTIEICAQDREGRIWMDNRYGAVGLWQNGRFRPLPGNATSYVFQVLEDREGDLWIATLDRGLYRLRKQIITMYRRPGALQQFNDIGPILQDRTGAIWVSSLGLAKFEAGRFRTVYHRGPFRNPDDWANMISALYEDRDGSIWSAMWNGSIVRLKAGRIHEEKFLSARIKGRIFAILRDRAGDLWLGGQEGLYRLHANVLTRFTQRDGLPADNVNVIHEDRAGTLWIGTSGGLVGDSGGRFTPVKGLQGPNIMALYEDNSGVLWVGTFDDGLYRLARTPDGIHLTRFTTAQGLYSNRIYQILEDKLGYLWMSCDLGLYRVPKQQLDDCAAGRASQITSTYFGEADGLGGECNGREQPMAFKAHDGRLWFATQGGIAVVDPRAVPASGAAPPVVIEDCLVDGQPMACRQGLRMKPGQANLEIHYTALSFSRPEQTRFNYKLEGLDRDWVEAGTRRTAYYSHVPPGQYIFKVIAVNSDGVWNLEGKSMPVIVPPPLYRTWWFLTLASLIAAGGVVLAWRYRVAQLKRLNTMQQAFSRQLINSQEQERKRIAAELHDSLGQHLLIIKNWAMLALTALHTPDTAVSEPLTEISATASQAVDEVRGIAYNLRPYQLEKLGLTTAIQDLVDQVSVSSGIQLIAEIGHLDGLFSQDVEISIYRIVQESLNNIVRHSQATAARIWVMHRAGVVELRIEDNGRGFTPPEGHTREPGRKGFGLLGIAERVRILGGQVAIQSAPGAGSAISISLRSQEAAR